MNPANPVDSVRAKYKRTSINRNGQGTACQVPLGITEIISSNTKVEGRTLAVIPPKL